MKYLQAIITGKDSLESLLHRLNMDDELEAFKKQSIKLETLEEMSESELTEALKEMDLNIGRRKKLSKEIIKMKSRKYITMQFTVEICLLKNYQHSILFLQKMTPVIVEQSMSLNVSKCLIKVLLREVRT